MTLADCCLHGTKWIPFEEREGTVIQFTRLDACCLSHTVTVLGEKVLRLEGNDGYPDRYWWITRPFDPGLGEYLEVTTRWYWRILAKLIGLWHETKINMRSGND